MSFNADETRDDNLEIWRDLKRQGVNINSLLSAWETRRVNLRTSIAGETDKETELDNLKSQLVTQLRNTLGI